MENTTTNEKELMIRPVLTDLLLTKSSQKECAEALIEKIREGEVDPVQAFSQVKAMGQVIDIFLKDKEVIDITVSEIEKYGRDGCTYGGANVTSTEAGVRYDYTVCDDPVWNSLNEQMESIKQRLKEREQFLRGLKEPLVTVDEESGEINKIYGPAKSSTTTVKVVFKK